MKLTQVFESHGTTWKTDPETWTLLRKHSEAGNHSALGHLFSVARGVGRIVPVYYHKSGVPKL